MAAFGQTAFGQNRIWPELVFLVFWTRLCCVVSVCVVCCVGCLQLCVWCVVCCVFGGCLQDFWWVSLQDYWWVSSRFLEPLRWTPPSAGLPQISLSFFSLSRRKCHSFFSLWGGLLVEFWWRGAQMCTFGLSGCRVKPRRRFKPHQNSTRRPPEREERMKFPAGERKKARIFGPPTLRAPHLFWVRAPTPPAPTP